MPPSMGSIFGMMFGDAQTEKQRSSTIIDAVWGYTDRDAAEIDKQGRGGNLEVPSAEQRMTVPSWCFASGHSLDTF